ncbi:MAG: hypothetical protein ACI8Y4_004836 [Candidatus Poriferisodalaceae bacterium]|jgi:hypothetical protein
MMRGTNSSIRSFAEAVAGGGVPVATGADGLRALEATIAAYASGATGNIVEMPLDRHSPAFLRGALGIPELSQARTSPFTDTVLFRSSPEAHT